MFWVKGASFNFNIYQLVGRYFKALSDRSDADGNIFFILFLAKKRWLPGRF